jgi:hypothetical protein
MAFGLGARMAGRVRIVDVFWLRSHMQVQGQAARSQACGQSATKEIDTCLVNGLPMRTSCPRDRRPCSLGDVSAVVFGIQPCRVLTGCARGDEREGGDVRVREPCADLFSLCPVPLFASVETLTSRLETTSRAWRSVVTRSPSVIFDRSIAYTHLLYR